MPNANEDDIGREELAEGRDHLTVTGAFQSDKYPWCPPGFVPIALKDPGARDLLREYAKRRGVIDPEFERDLLEALTNTPEKQNAGYAPFKTVERLREMLLQFCASLTLCDHMGDVGNDMELVLKELGVALDETTYGERAEDWVKAVVNGLRLHGITTTLYGTPLGSDEDEEDDGKATDR